MYYIVFVGNKISSIYIVCIDFAITNVTCFKVFTPHGIIEKTFLESKTDIQYSDFDTIVANPGSPQRHNEAIVAKIHQTFF